MSFKLRKLHAKNNRYIMNSNLLSFRIDRNAGLYMWRAWVTGGLYYQRVVKMLPSGVMPERVTRDFVCWHSAGGKNLIYFIIVQSGTNHELAAHFDVNFGDKKN